MNLLIYLFIIVGGGAGIISTLYLTVALPVIIFKKIYRSCKYKISLFD